MSEEIEFASKQDRTSTIRQQTSRIYMTTIAANEREDRLLTRKLDALDLEHRSEFIKMKKWISYTETTTRKKFPEFGALKSQNNAGRQRHSIASIPTVKFRNFKNKQPRSARTQCKLCSVSDKSHLSQSCPESKSGVCTHALSTSPGGTLAPLANTLIKTVSRKKSWSLNLEVENTKKEDPLNDRLKYTEQEVGRLRKSWAGRKTPPKRKSSFLPHLQDTPNIQIPMTNEQRVKRYSRGMLWDRNEKALPAIEYRAQRKQSSLAPVSGIASLTVENVTGQQLSKSAPGL